MEYLLIFMITKGNIGHTITDKFPTYESCVVRGNVLKEEFPTSLFKISSYKCIKINYEKNT